MVGEAERRNAVAQAHAAMSGALGIKLTPRKAGAHRTVRGDRDHHRPANSARGRAKSHDRLRDRRVHGGVVGDDGAAGAALRRDLLCARARNRRRADDPAAVRLLVECGGARVWRTGDRRRRRALRPRPLRRARTDGRPRDLSAADHRYPGRVGHAELSRADHHGPARDHHPDPHRGGEGSGLRARLARLQRHDPDRRRRQLPHKLRRPALQSHQRDRARRARGPRRPDDPVRLLPADVPAGAGHRQRHPVRRRDLPAVSRAAAADGRNR